MRRLKLEKLEEILGKTDSIEYKDQQIAKAKINGEPNFQYGLFLGEIIWNNLLSRHTFFDLVKCITEEEKQENKTINEELNLLWERKRKDKTIKTEEQKEWINHLKNYRYLQYKYLPHELKYQTFIHYVPDNFSLVYKGICKFLWDTDLCAYWFKEEDIVLEYNTIGKELTIVFKLEALSKI